MAKQLGFYLEQNYCIGCKTCQLACKDKNNLDLGLLLRKVWHFEGGGYKKQGNGLANNVYSYWTSMACNHCKDPKCVENCPTGAMYKRAEDGVVLVNPDKCIGCRYCTWSCPYEAPKYDPVSKRIVKCDFCVDYLAQGKEPACVGACIMRVLHFGDLEELEKKYGDVKETKGMPSPKYTNPSLVINPHQGAVK